MNINKILSTSLIAIVSLLAISTIVIAATDLIAPLAPNPSVGTMKTLEDIYQRIVAGTEAIGHTLNPSAGPAGTMHTLTDIYNAVPTNDKVCIGTNDGTANCITTLEWSPEIMGGDWVDWNTAKAYCENPENGYLRLPTIEELISALTTNYFSGGDFVIDHSFWSSHEANEGTGAWIASYASSNINATISNKENGGVARCVR